MFLRYVALLSYRVGSLSATSAKISRYSNYNRSYIEQARRKKVPFQHFNSRLKQQQQQQATKMVHQEYDYFLVLDFEATCDEGKKKTPQEIIEFPVLKVNAKTFEIESQFHQFVKPTHHPKLSTFCMDLTSITQSEVDAAKPFRGVFQDFKLWIETDVGLDKRFLFVTCGNWDLMTMLPSQCAIENLQVPSYCKSWLNIKRSYAIVKGEYVKGMMPMLKGLMLDHVGILHRGLDDTKNIANILKALANLNCRFLPTHSIE